MPTYLCKPYKDVFSYQSILIEKLSAGETIHLSQQETEERKDFQRGIILQKVPDTVFLGHQGSWWPLSQRAGISLMHHEQNVAIDG